MSRCISIVFLIIFSVTMAQASDYKTTVDGWDSYQDVAEWIKSNWRFDHGRARDVVGKIRREGPTAAVTKSSEETFDLRRGWCKDAARFAKDTLNTIDPAYKAGYLFIKNKMGPPHHWVTGFRYNGKLYVMDYGAGPEWRGMMGVHGPYDSIDEYGEFDKRTNQCIVAFEFAEYHKSGQYHVDFIFMKDQKQN